MCIYLMCFSKEIKHIKRLYTTMQPYYRRQNRGK